MKEFKVTLTHLWQGLVMHDPEIPLDRTLVPSPPTRPKHPVFDNEDMGKVGDKAHTKSLSCVCVCVCARVIALSVGWAPCSTYPCVLFQLLAELLRSKNPEDLQEANRLIKNMVKEVSTAQLHYLSLSFHTPKQPNVLFWQGFGSNRTPVFLCSPAFFHENKYLNQINPHQDEARVHKVTKRIHMLEEVNINVKLLTEMLSQYNKDSSTDSDREIIKVCVSWFSQSSRI